MNATSPSEKLVIDSEVGMKIMRRALYDRLLATFQLHPGQIAKDLIELSKSDPSLSPLERAVMFKPLVVKEFEDALVGVNALLVGSRLWLQFAKPTHPKFGRQIRVRFNLLVPELASGARDWCGALGIRPAEFVTAIRPWVIQTINSSFDKAIEIIKKSGGRN